MEFDLEHIASLGPFIVTNISECIYIIVTCLSIGFLIGKAYQKYSYRSQIEELKKELANTLSKNEELNKENQKLLDTRGNTKTNNTLSTLNDLLTSNPNEFEFTALLEISMKRDRTINDVSAQE